MRSARFGAVLPLVAAAAGCVESVYPPATTTRSSSEIRHVVTVTAGSGRRVQPGDRVMLRLRGRYRTGELFADGSFTTIVGGRFAGSIFESAVLDQNVGTVRRFVLDPEPDQARGAGRFVTLASDDPEHESFRYRRDRGDLDVELTIESACHPRKLVLVDRGMITVQLPLGCR